MDVPDFFQATAEVGIGLAGFSGLIFAMRKQPGPLTDVEKYRMGVLFATAFGAVFMSFLPSLVARLVPDGTDIWAFSSSVFAIYSGIFLLRWIFATRRTAGAAPEIFSWPVFYSIFAGHVLALLLQVSVVLGAWGTRGAGIYGICLLWYLAHGSQQFARMLFVQPRA